MDRELIFWIVAAILGLVAFGLLRRKARREAVHYLEWME